MEGSGQRASETRDPKNVLSAREREILELVGTGVTNQQIANQLIISINTVKTHLRKIYTKLGVESRTEATRYGIQHGLIEIERPTSPGPAGPQIKERPAVPAPHLVPWPVGLAQRAAMLVALVLVLLVVLWPGAQAGSSLQGGRFVDVPQPVSPEAELEGAFRWRAGLQMSTPRGRFAQAAVDGKILVIGGLTDQGATDQVECYDPSLDRWERRAPKPTAIGNMGAAVVDGLVYVPGGCDEANNVLDVLEVYDPASDTWSTAAPLPVPLCSYAIASVEGGFYLFGGWNGQGYVDSTYCYDATEDTWHEEAPLGFARGFAAAARAGDRIFVVGGHDGLNESRACESYDLGLARSGQDPWRTHVPMSVGRAGHSVVEAEGYLYVVGGGWDSYLDYNERYDVANDAWSVFDSPIVGEWRALGLTAMTTRQGSVLYAIGGWNGRYLGVVQAYQATYRLYLP